jgi:hypothetical protein
MSATLSGPALNATGSDPLSEPPAPPPASASNHPDDHTAGIPGEMAAEAQGEIADARSGKDQQVDPALADAQQEPPKTEEETADAALKSDKTPPWMKAEITKERNRRREAETQRQAALDAQAASDKRLADALEALKARETPPEPEKPTVTETPRPTRADFDTPEAYDAAVDTWAAVRADAAAKKAQADLEAKAEADRAAAEKAANETRIQAEVAELGKSWQVQKTAAIEKYPDYVEVAENPDVRIDVPMAHTAIQAENGADILYHLGKNPEEAARIAGLTPARQIFEIGRLSATLAQRATVDVSRAPPPIAPLNSSREAASDTGREESMEEVAARVNKREAAARSPMWGTRH